YRHFLRECAYYADQDYKCVPYYTCEDGEIVTDGGGLIDIRSSFAAVLDPASSKCPGYLEVCCRHPEYSTNAPKITATTTQEPVTEPPRPRAYEPQCGRRNFGGVGVRIQNDKYKGSTQFGEWPHMCAVLETEDSSYGKEINKYVCGASLIAPGVVLTGAHCVAKVPKENLKIRCGEWDTQQEIEPSQHQDRFVQNVKIHPQFNPKNLKNDFAILFMEDDFELAPHVDTICLPDNLAGINSYDQTNCVATGWGKDKFGKLGEYQVIMKQSKWTWSTQLSVRGALGEH
ncbi:Serine protease -like protein 21, partial [Caligus rogercresseyi]